MSGGRLGPEVRRLRTQAGLSLRAFAAELDISAAHLSDIEHDRRRPSERLLRKIAHELRDVGAAFHSLEMLVTGLDRETREWAASTPGARAVLRKILESGQDPAGILRVLDEAFADRDGRRGRTA